MRRSLYALGALTILAAPITAHADRHACPNTTHSQAPTNAPSTDDTDLTDLAALSDDLDADSDDPDAHSDDPDSDGADPGDDLTDRRPDHRLSDRDRFDPYRILDRDRTNRNDDRMRDRINRYRIPDRDRIHPDRIDHARTFDLARPTAPAPARLSTDAPVELSALERAVLDEVNALRRDPRAYAAHARALVPLFRGRLLERPGQPDLVTQEGARAVAECARALAAARPVPTLRIARGLTLAARQHARDLGRTGSTGHTGSDGSTPVTRIERFGRWDGRSGENIEFGPSNGRDIVLALAIDDGVPSRGHRTNLLRADYTRIGIGCAPHPTYGTVCVMDFAAKYEDR